MARKVQLMPEFRFLNLGEDVIAASLKEVQPDTWLIYPTERSCREALKAFQQNWQPLNTEFLSMEDFKCRLIYSDQVRLQDEKRLVCLYQAMTTEDKAVYHIDKYPDLIEWGQHFFQFLEELAEECIDAEQLLKRMHNNEFSYQDWQLGNYTQLLKIREQYKAFITAKGYTDAIFDNDITNLHLPSEVKRFVFVNQFYYTGMEKQIISQLETLHRKVIICFQGNEDWLDKDTLKSRDFTLDEAFPDSVLPFTLQAFQSSNLWQMALGFLDRHSVKSTGSIIDHFIIDAGFIQQPYHKVFPREVFQYSEPLPVHNTRLFHFFQIMAVGLDNLIRDNGKKLIKLDWLLQAIGMEGFVSYFRPDWNPAQIDAFIGFVCKFSEKDILYLDVHLDVMHMVFQDGKEAECENLLADIISLLERLSGICDIRGFLSLIDSETGIYPERLLSEEEKTGSNLLESWYEALANYLAMDELALVEDWQTLYPNSGISAGIFDLFLSFVKPRTYQYNCIQSENPAAVITNLMDTRNLQAQKVTFLNLVEGELPGVRTPVWLFNERQRHLIGMKNWDDIRSWERYYFYRLAASAREVEICTLANQDKNVEPSSFLNEMLLHHNTLHKDNPVLLHDVIPSADTLLLNWIQPDQANPLSENIPLDAAMHPAFFNLPCDLQADFGQEKRINLSWTACEHFIKNPFLYYLQDRKKLRERVKSLPETMGRKMFGILLHSYLNVITRRLAEQHQGVLSMQWEWINREFLSSNLKSALAQPLLYFQIPKNYNWEYLKALLSPFLVDTASWFFQVGLAKDEDLKNHRITLIPETDNSSEYEQHYKLLIHPEENEFGLGIAIRGRADLRLETADKRFIIDFKTGSSNNMQLLFYQWFYYLIEQPELKDDLRTAFYKLMDKQLQWLEKTTKSTPDKLTEKLVTSLDTIVQNGYAPATDSQNRKYSIDITRADLLRNLPFTEEEE